MASSGRFAGHPRTVTTGNRKQRAAGCPSTPAPIRLPANEVSEAREECPSFADPSTEHTVERRQAFGGHPVQHLRGGFLSLHDRRLQAGLSRSA